MNSVPYEYALSWAALKAAMKEIGMTIEEKGRSCLNYRKNRVADYCTFPGKILSECRCDRYAASEEYVNQLEAELADLHLHAIPDWDEPGVVPELNGEYGFQFHDKDAVWRCVSIEIDDSEQNMYWDGQVFSLVRLPEIFKWFRFTDSPIPLPREKE